eukprot:2944205-Amphidinium_carterae.1
MHKGQPFNTLLDVPVKFSVNTANNVYDESRTSTSNCLCQAFLADPAFSTMVTQGQTEESHELKNR